jgi:hypothetical protein
VTHAGFVGVNHYQTAKAAIEGVKAVRRGGQMVIVANHTEPEPVGSANYRRALRALSELGAEKLLQRMLAPDWEFIPEQWQAQLWAQSLVRLGDQRNLIYCSPRLTGADFATARVPGTDGGAGLKGLAGRDLAEAMVQRAIDRFIEQHPGGRIAVLRDGPYGVPVLGA